MMYPVGGYYAMPSPVELRKMWAGTRAEEAAAAAIEGSREARDVVDDVNFVRYEMRRLDQTEADADGEKNSVQVNSRPKKLNFFQKLTGIGSSPVEEIASAARGKGKEVAGVTGVMTDKEMDVTVSYNSDDEALVYSKVESEDGSVFFQRGNETVGIDPNGNLVMQQL